MKFRFPDEGTVAPEIGPDTRDENLDRLARQTFDVCVIGGGITGVGVALDAVSRGLSVALVEREDFGAGTSSKSSKMVHGGLRYLAGYQLGVFYESIRERNLLHSLAPNLVRPVRFLAPVFRKGLEARLAPLGLGAYDLVSGGSGFGFHHRADARTIREIAPLLNPDRVAAAWTYWDAQTDDTRLVFEVARTAHRLGAVLATHANVIGFDTSGGRIVAAFVEDAVGGQQITVGARVFISASGIWAGDVARLDEESPALRVRPAKGIHVIVPSSRLPVAGACIIPSGVNDRRSLFAIPWYGATLIGTTDTDYVGALDAPTVDADDLGYVLHAANHGFEIDLTQADLISAFAGLRPLLDAGGARTADISRRHAIIRSTDGLITITGGKLTTYRRMAEDAMDVACRQLHVRARSGTKKIMIGEKGSPQETLERVRAHAVELGLDPAVGERLAGTHGDRALELLAMVAADPTLNEEVVPGVPVLLAEIAWAFHAEMAVSLEDALARRTRLALLDRAGGLGGSERVRIAAGMDPKTFAQEAVAYGRRLRRERGALSTGSGEPLTGEPVLP
ncbi:MAG: glycerol-3-phosphate dehydrogenase/oxidase [Actinomycetota bacterium]